MENYTHVSKEQVISSNMLTSNTGEKLPSKALDLAVRKRDK